MLSQDGHLRQVEAISGLILYKWGSISLDFINFRDAFDVFGQFGQPSMLVQYVQT